MNIFVLNKCPWMSARMMCDKHVIKMILESAQILSTVHVLCDENIIAYKPTHRKHPCVLWAAKCNANYNWLFNHFLGLLNEYHHRYKKIHVCYFMVNTLSNIPDNIEISDVLTNFALAMPDEYKDTCAIQSYKDYYISKRQRGDWIFKYTNRQIPEFLAIVM